MVHRHNVRAIRVRIPANRANFKKAKLEAQIKKNDESVLVKVSSEPYIGPYWGLDQCSVIVTH